MDGDDETLTQIDDLLIDVCNGIQMYHLFWCSLFRRVLRRTLGSTEEESYCRGGSLNPHPLTGRPSEVPVTCNLYPFLKRIPTTNLHHMLKHFPIPRLGLMRCASSASIQRGLLSRAGSASQLSERQPVAAGQEYIIVFEDDERGSIRKSANIL